ncbi:Tyrosine recombinase XerC [Microbacterium laevaniformans]|uniref:Tyrosine recombinase XerC n=1 Tax=Microbacterium laevaniformans TaxID=36807 RepID=A0A150HH68_9MICO|nr:tyrosine-type recombinase/integrase [Microbacterium laevaniformans]KXZ61421.1 Tyrosine recombinase XerC [Microbacterium laevaniformans]
MSGAPDPADEAQGREKKQRRSRSRQPGSLQEYPTCEGKRWRFQIYVPKDPEYPELGSRRLTRSGFTSTEAANDALQDALKQRKQNDKFSGQVPLIGPYADEWVAGLKLADSTIAGYKKIIRNHITPQLGDIRLDKLTATRVARHYRDLEKHGRADKLGKGQPLSANSVHKIHVVLGAILDAAIEDGHLTVNPTKKKRTVKAPTSSEVRAQKPEIATWTAEQLSTFLAWDRDVLEDELFPLWRLIAFSGMRRGEALALRWNDINTKTMRISIRRAVNTENWSQTKTTKTGSARVIDMDAETLKVLAAYKVARAELSFELAKADAFVFSDDDGRLRSPDAMTSRWDRRLKSATATFESLTRVTLKGLRHTHATLLLELGEHPKVVQERLGHSTITTTMNIYSHVTPTMQRPAVDRFAAHLGKA